MRTVAELGAGRTTAVGFLPAAHGICGRNVDLGASPLLMSTDENPVASQLYVTCNDSNWPRSIEEYQRNVARARAEFPQDGPAGANITPCAFWPYEPMEPPVRISNNGPANILLVQNLRDPATPLTGATEMRTALGDRARMITVDQGGHGACVVGTNACANNALAQFLSEGQRPAEDTFCAKQ